jgi:hypothetical protein
MIYYKCDRCKAEIPYKGERKKVVITDYIYDYYEENKPMEREIDLCDDCGRMLNNFLQKRVLDYSDISGGRKNGKSGE